MEALRSRRLGYALAFAVLGLTAGHIAERLHSNTWIFRDGRFYVNVNEGILERGSLEDVYAHSWYNGELGWNYNLPASFSNIALGSEGEYFSFRPYLLPVLATPLYWAFGLGGTLLFNFLLFGLIGAGAYRFGRRFSESRVTAALASIVLLFGSGVQHFQYDYSVDILLLALLAVSFTSAYQGSGLMTGAAFGLALIVKPTTLLLFPVLLLPFAERRDLRGVIRATLAGGVTLGLGGLMNWEMFGRPWWFGYQRVLAVEQGQQVLVSDVDAFSTPLAQGLRDMWAGPWGVSHRWTAFGLFAPGAIYLWLKRRPYAAVSSAVVIANVILFAKFHWSDDRYLFPTAWLLVPFVVGTLELLSIGCRWLLRGIGHRSRAAALTPAWLAALVVVWIGVTTLPFRDQSPAERLGNGPYVMGALAWGAGHFDLRGAYPDLQIPDAETSIITRGRFGHWLPRASPAAVTVATPFTALGSRAGLIGLHLLAAGLFAFTVARLAGRCAGRALGATLTVGLAFLPPLRDTIVVGGPPLLAAAAAAWALERANSERWLAAGLLAGIAPWLADAPWLLALAVIPLAALDGRRALRDSLAGVGGVLLFWGVVHLFVIGRPFASPEDFVAYEWAGVVEAVRVPREGDWPSLSRWLASPSPLRSLIPVLAIAAAGLPWLVRRDPRLLWMVAATASTFLLATNQRESAVFLVILAVAVPFALAARWFGQSATHLEHWFKRDQRRTVAAVTGALLALFLVGVSRRLAAAAEPWHTASEAAVKTAEVTLGDVPCDFLAWEHMAWECSHYDGSPYAVSGLNVWHGVFVGGERHELFVLTTGDRLRRPRTARWRDVPASGETLVLRWAVPDGLSGGGIATVRVDGTPVHRFDLPDEPSGTLQEQRVPLTTEAATVDLEFEVESRSPRRATLAFDAWFE